MMRSCSCRFSSCCSCGNLCDSCCSEDSCSCGMCGRPGKSMPSVSSIMVLYTSRKRRPAKVGIKPWLDGYHSFTNVLPWLKEEQQIIHWCRDHFVYVPSQWETLQCSFSQWLGACTEWSLLMVQFKTAVSPGCQHFIPNHPSSHQY